MPYRLAGVHTVPVSPRAVVVDDHPGFRRMAGRLLTAAGYAVVGEAATAREAVEVVQRLQPAFVLLDVLLPDGNGVDVAERLRAVSTAVVLLTSSRSADDIAPGMSERVFLTKADLTIDRLRGICADE
jgi:DNA-binding NarL/FixJ family response regulator